MGIPFQPQRFAIQGRKSLYSYNWSTFDLVKPNSATSSDDWSREFIMIYQIHCTHPNAFRRNFRPLLHQTIWFNAVSFTSERLVRSCVSVNFRIRSEPRWASAATKNPTSVVIEITVMDKLQTNSLPSFLGTGQIFETQWFEQNMFHISNSIKIHPLVLTKPQYGEIFF